MIVLKKKDPGASVETTMTIAGTEFSITLLPLPLKDHMDAFAPFRKRKNVPNPISGRMEFMEYFDDKDDKYLKVAEDLLDKHVVNFKGVAIPGADGQPVELDGTKRENKILLGSVKVEDFEEIRVIDPETKEEAVIPRPRMRYFRALIFDKCNELADTIAEAVEKNSETPSGADTTDQL
jgi:hypothetical protein